VVLSSLDPRRTLLELSDPGWLDPEVARALAHVRCRGIATLAQVELERSPDFAALTLAPSLDYVERAWDGAKHGRVSDQPWLEATAAVRPGKAALEVLVQYTPFSPADGSWDESRRDSISRLVVRLLSEHAQLSDIRHVSVLTPPDLERDRHWPGGHAYHGELGLDQVLFMRPVPGMARYRTPVAGLYLCGPGTHPAGALAGVSGALAAREALRDRS
jgi:phytoene dehydrogenase-like protein